ncbi:MAG: diguanylate cyclase, partial [Candidatus Sericytochromatia bacterium]
FLVFGGLRFIDQRRRIERQGEKMEVLYHLTKKMGESVLLEADIEVDPGHVFDHLFTNEASSIKRLITNQRTSVYRVQQLGEDMRIVHAKSDSLLEPEKIYHMDEPGLLQEIVRARQGVRLTTLSQLGKGYSTWRIAYQSLMAQPILVDEEVTFILVMFRTAGDAFHERDEKLLKLLINAFEITLKNLQLRNKIQEQAIKDGLMGIFNHRYMKVKLEEEMARAKRYSKPLTLIIADVDYFKKFNDTHGHLLGDKVLKEIAGILQDSVRETDIVARYGGEELAILLPETPLDAACDVAERIRRNVSSHAFTGKEQQVVAMSLSVGVSCLFEELELEPSELIIRTDTALYRAKHQGRNQICRAQIERGRLVIETYSRGVSPQPSDVQSEQGQSGLLRPELRKLWDEQLEKSLPELERKLRHELEQAALTTSLERFFDKKLLPAIPELLKAMAQTELDVRGELLANSQLVVLLEQLQQAAARRLQGADQLRLLQQLLLKTYRHFVRQCLALSASESERRSLFNQGWRVIMQIQDRLFVTSLDRVEEQIGFARSQHRFARQLLCVLAQYRQPQAPLIEVLRQVQAVVPQLRAVFLARPEPVGTQLQMEVWLPQDAPLSLNLVLQDQIAIPKPEPCLLELKMEDVRDYLQLAGDLPEQLPEDLAPVLIPLWQQERLHGLIGLLLPQDQPLSQPQRHWLKGAAIELAETMQLLDLLEAQQDHQITTLKTLVDVVQGSQGSFRAERMASLAMRLGQRLGLPADEQQHLKDAAYLFQLGALVVTGQSPSQRRQAQMLNQRLLGALSLNGLEQPLRHVLERWDGSGFPDGLSALRIPLASRILGLVCAYVDSADEKHPPLERVEELGASGYYDPKLCALLKEMIRESNT